MLGRPKSLSRYGFFGKLPSHPEFVRHNLASDAGRDVMQWVSEVWRRCGTYTSLEFVVHRPPRAHMIYGACRTSRDSYGRRAPFLHYVVLKNPGECGVSPFLLSHWLNNSMPDSTDERTIATFWGDRVHHELSLREGYLSRQMEDVLEEVSCGELFSTIFPVDDAGQRRYAFATLWQASRRLLSQRNVGFALELPAPNNRCHIFWHYYLKSLLDRGEQTSTLIWWHDLRSPITVQREMLPADGRLWKLTTTGEEARIRVGERLPEPWRASLNRPRVSLQDFAKNLLIHLDRKE